LEKPFSAVGRLIVFQREGDTLASLAVEDKVFTPEVGVNYDVSITEHIPGEIVDVAHKDRAASGNHYLIRHKDGTPLDPSAQVFVMRLDTDEDARAAVSFYIERRTLTAAVAGLAATKDELVEVKGALNEQHKLLAELGREFGASRDYVQQINLADEEQDPVYVYELLRDISGVGHKGMRVVIGAHGRFFPAPAEDQNK
jgi:hypothetical protein